MSPVLLFYCNWFIFNIVYGFRINPTNWQNGDIVYSNHISTQNININLAACGSISSIVYLFGGRTVDFTPTYYPNINTYDVVNDKLNSEAWATWQASPPTKFRVDPHKYAQSNVSDPASNYISAGGFNPDQSPPSFDRFVAALPLQTSQTATATDSTFSTQMSQMQNSNQKWCTYIYNDVLYFTGYSADSIFYYATVSATDVTDSIISGTAQSGQPAIIDHACVIYYQSPSSATVYTFGGEDYSTGKYNQTVRRCLPDYSVCQDVPGSANGLWSMVQAVVVDDLIFVMGGLMWPGEISETYLTQIKVWDPLANVWLDRDPLPFFGPNRFNYHVQWLTEIKRLVIIGGASGNAYTADTSIYIYNFTELTQPPTPEPTPNPTTQPTPVPTTANPTRIPTLNPTTQPTDNPTNQPTLNPTTNPSVQPTLIPTNQPTLNPTNNPSTLNPTNQPSTNPTNNPTTQPTSNPTQQPTANPTALPTPIPTPPTNNPTPNPTPIIPTTAIPTTSTPTIYPSTQPSPQPTLMPTTVPTTPNPTQQPTPIPSPVPTTSNPTPVIPTTAVPTTSNPTTTNPTASNPTTIVPTSMPTTANPTPVTNPPSTNTPTTSNPTPVIPTTSTPTTMNPTTPNPTLYPTAPTLAPTFCVFSASAIWSPTFLSILIRIDAILCDILLEHSRFKKRCNDIFGKDTLNKIDGDNSICTWNTDNNADYTIKIDLPSTATIDVSNNSMVIKPGAFRYHNVKDDNSGIPLAYYIYIASVAMPDLVDIISPNIIISAPSKIGSCDSLTLDARKTTQLGGRDNAIFEWYIMNINHTVIGNNLITINDVLLSDISNSVIYITLTVTTWYDISSSMTVKVFKSSQDIVPILQLNGPSEISSESIQLLNGQIDILSTITVYNGCSKQRIKLEEDDYSVNWFVSVETQNNNDTQFIGDKLESLLTYLANENGESLSISAEKQLQSGLIYTFTMGFECTDDDINDCKVNATHVLLYSFSDIVCQIAGGDIQLIGVTFDYFQSYVMKLDCKSFTYDPDHKYSIDHLVFNWQCADTTNNNTLCHLLSYSTLKPNINVYFDGILPNSIMLGYEYAITYTFTLDVYDQDNTFRDHCSTEMLLTVYLIDDDTNNNTPHLLIISVTPISNEINVADKVRILANIVNNDDYNDPYITTFKWSEVNGILTDNEMIDYSDSNENSLNLVLQSHVLTEGISYSFQLTVFQNGTDDNTLVAYGQSSITTIYVLTPPTIIDGSFIVSPECSDGSILYNTINDYQDTYTLSVTADGDYTPLLYQFVYNTTNVLYYIHPYLLSTSYINNVYLPIGELELTVNVYDTKSSSATDTISCEIMLGSYEECPQGLEIEEDDYLSEYEKYSDILQRVLIHLQYIYDYYVQIDDVQECLKEYLESVLEVLDEEIGDLCSSNFVIQLSQIMKLWIDLANINDNLLEEFYDDDNLEAIEKIIFKILDPCLFITDGIQNNVEGLTISDDSVITGIIKIYYNNIDITSLLSITIVYDHYKNLFYSLTESLIDLIVYSVEDNYEIAFNIYNLLSRALYIASLSSLSVSIPGEELLIEFEEFSIYATKVSDNDVNVTLQAMSVYISGDNIQLDDNTTSVLDSAEMVIIGLNTTERTVNVSDDNIDCDEHATLSQQSISITILGNNADTDNLPSDVLMRFDCDNSDEETDCNSVECVWYNESSDTWDTSGCVSSYNDIDNQIECSCSHLTTFATIHNIQESDECDTSSLINDLLLWEYWDIINWCFAGLFLIISIYIFIQILPFCIDKDLVFKHPSIFAMCLLCMVSLFYCIICVQFHFIKIDQNNLININILTFILLASLCLYVGIYSMTFYSWFLLAHSMTKYYQEKLHSVKIMLCAVHILIIIFATTVFILVILIETKEFLLIIEIIWCCILLLFSVVFIIYAIRVGRILLAAAKTSDQKDDKSVFHRLIFINGCITIFFIIQLFLAIYFTIYSQKYGIMYRIIDLVLNVLFILLLCWMYGKPIKILTRRHTGDKYDYYYLCCLKKCVPNYKSPSHSKMEKLKSVSSLSSPSPSSPDSSSNKVFSSNKKGGSLIKYHSGFPSTSMHDAPKHKVQMSNLSEPGAANLMKPPSVSNITRYNSDGSDNHSDAQSVDDDEKDNDHEDMYDIDTTPQTPGGEEDIHDTNDNAQSEDDENEDMYQTKEKTSGEFHQ